MNWRSRGVSVILIALGGLHAACQRGDARDSYELGVIENLEQGSGRLAVSGERAYRYPGEVVETIDLTDPRNPHLFGAAEVGLGCLFGCSGIVVTDNIYISSIGTLMRVPDWISPNYFIGEAGLDAVSPTALVAGGSALIGSSDSLSVIDLDGEIPTIVAKLDEQVFAQVVSGTNVFVTNASNGMAVFDLQNPANPNLLSRIPLSPRDGWLIAPEAPYLSSTLALSGTSDLFATTVDPTVAGFVPPCRVNWFKFDILTGSSTFLDDAAEEDLGGCTSIAAYENYVFVGARYEVSDPDAQAGGVWVYRADPLAGLVLTARIHIRPYDIAIDPVRGLMIVSAAEAVHIFDLGKLTSGVPSWP